MHIAQRLFLELSIEEALSFLDQVKRTFRSQPKVYEEFLRILKDFQMGCVSTPVVINHVSNLFRGYPELIVGFNTFLPLNDRITVPLDQFQERQSELPHSTPGNTSSSHPLPVPNQSHTNSQNLPNQDSSVDLESSGGSSSMNDPNSQPSSRILPCDQQYQPN